MLLNGKELDLTFSSFDADDMEKYEIATQHLIDRDAEFAIIKKTGLKTYEAIRFHCHTIFEFFNIIFGEGSDRKIFGDKTDLSICFTTLGEFTQLTGKGSDEVISLASKYLSSRVNSPKKQNTNIKPIKPKKR